ncbi:membrane protein [Tamlana sedimentorum]|uniref:Membrane protein n=1 Tax=Neotamlana sedimentorum TaxID=1435349 RepID=A0A0D7W3K0_9FLAO|nr:membrane protein [Tamlana sedimentorum]KJD33705.1 membrane protein [Tamlana sedimentorum]
MKPEKSNKYLIAALLLGLAFHGSSIFFTLETTYDALIHLFFADHYANSWFEPWNYEWYTGFTVQSYPPLVHQSIGLLSYVGGLKFGMFSVALIAIVLFITGSYRFSLLITGNRTVAGYASVLAVFSSSFVETLHIFGQLPSIVGVSVLMHALPEIYLWIKTGKKWYLATCLSLISVTVTSHHVTPIFGMVFFIFPLIGMVIMDVSREQVNSNREVTFRVFLNSFFKLFKRIVIFGGCSLVLIIGCILPYWINSKANPITQVPIPHGSRDNFLEITSSGLVFFLIPWGVLLVLLPYIFYRYYSKRYIFFGLSITILTILGTGGTTPIPLKVLGETAFNILTLDRFTLWASIMSIPLMGEFAYRFVEGDLKTLIQNKLGAIYHRIIGGILTGLFVFMVVFTMSLNYFRPSQPQKIKMLPIVNFLNQDDHDKWRFLTLGFGDQMAWLSAQTNAMTVDGNYHSARRLPELTTRPIERLENSKFKGVAGIGSLQQFLTTPEKYNLKYIFSNDKFYDPILFFCGWQRLRQLENGIMVWERLNIPPVSSILPKEDVAKWLKLHWGIMPFLTVLIAFILNIQMLWVNMLKTRIKPPTDFLKFHITYSKFNRNVLRLTHIWSVFLASVVFYGIYLFYLKNDSQRSPENAIITYYDALDFKEFEKAHSLINPNSNLPIAQYMLEISVTDGLLSSYAKMDAISTEIKLHNDSTATAKVYTNWITPLEKIAKTDYKSLTKIKGKWYLQSDELDNDLPPDQLYSNNVTKYYNQGRRRITTEQTHHEDILKQPVLEVITAKLVKYDGSYAIIGEIQNIDNVPADVILKGTLYNDNNKQLATYNAKYHVKHKLMPKETSSFRINFEGIAWSKTQDSIPDTFNPDEFTPVEFNEQPTKFNLQVAGNVAGSDLYKSVVLSDLNITPNQITGNLFNSGIQEITIPQLLITYYDENKSMLWVDHLFVKEGVRQERKQNFSYSILNEGIVKTINSSMENIFVNGLPNDDISNKIVPNRIFNHISNELQPIKHPNFSFIRIEINTYIASPF